MGGDDKHTCSTAADQPAPFPDYKVTWLWGGGGGGLYDKHTRSTAADQPAPLPDYKVTWLWGGGWGGGVGMISTPAQLLQTSLLLYRITCSFTGLQSNMVLGGGGDNPLNCCRPACSFTGLQGNPGGGEGLGGGA